MAQDFSRMAGMLPNRELEEMSYLWTSGEWRLRCIWQTVVRLVVRFKGEQASVNEIAALRRLVPTLSKLPVSQLREKIGSGSAFLVGEFSGFEASSLKQRAERLGFQIETEGCTKRSCLPMKEDTCLLIDDAELSEKVVQRMIEQGVPVDSIEVD